MIVLKLLAALACVLANAFFVAAEFALVKVRATQLETRAQQGERSARNALRVLAQLEAYLSASQLGITLASLVLGWLGEPAIAALLQPVFAWLGVTSPVLIHGISFAVGFSVITTLHIVLGEQAPKLLAIHRAEAVVLWVAAPMRLFYVLTWPALWVLNSLSNLVLRTVGLATEGHSEGALSIEEIRLVVASGKLEARQRQLLERVLEGTRRPVRAVMVPRVDMEVVSLEDPPGRVLEQLRKTGFSRVPVTEGHDADAIVGYLYIKDLFVGDGMPPGGLRTLRRDALYVPEARQVGDVLGDMQRSRIPLAIVVDEWGGTSGLVTLEDIVEEIVGDLQDELDDVEPPRIQPQADGSILADGILPLSELEPYGVTCSGEQRNDLVAGYLMSTLGRLPRPGDLVRLGDWEITVEDVRDRRVGRVRLARRVLTPRPQSAEPTTSADS